MAGLARMMNRGGRVSQARRCSQERTKNSTTLLENEDYFEIAVHAGVCGSNWGVAESE